jgi:AAHS family 4-hydroxybenzoate transporter-like MFS transporter
VSDARSIRAAAEAAPLNRYHIRIIILVAAITVFDGYDNFVPSYVIHFTRDAWHLNLEQAGFLVSSGLIGFMVGAMVNGSIADRFGRKPTLIGALLIAGVFSTLTGVWAQSFESFVLLRVLTGVGLGVLLPLSTAYMNELMPQRISNVAAIVATGGYTIGGTLAGLAGVFLAKSHGWEILFLLGALAIPMALLCFAMLPESPLFLVGAGRADKVASLMRALAPDDGHHPVSYFLDEEVTRKGSIALLLNADNRGITLLFWVVEILILFDAYGLIGWIPTVMMTRGETFASGFGFGALLQIMSLFGALGCGFVADRTGNRQKALAIWWGIGVLSLVGLALTNTHLLNMIFVGLCGFAILGPLLVLNNLVAQSFETEVRGTAVGMALGVGRIGGIIGPIVGGWVQQVAGDTQAMFLVMAATCVVSIGAVLRIRHHARGEPKHSGGMMAAQAHIGSVRKPLPAMKR